MRRKSAWQLVLTCLVVSMMIIGMGISTMALTYVDMITLGGVEGSDPLRVEVYDNGRLGLYFWQYEGGDPEYDQIYQHQYYSDDCWGTNIFFNDGADSIHYSSDYYVDWGFSTPAGIDFGLGTLVQDGNTVSGTWMLEEGDITFEQLVTYIPGSYMYEKVFRLTNNTDDIEYSNLKIIHGGDTYFGGDDDASSYWNEGLNMIFLRNASMDLYGIMGFAGTAQSPADQYFGGNYNLGGNFALSGDLPNTADPNYVDAGYQLQWNSTALAPGETWEIRSYELITEPNALQMISPVDKMADPCDEVEYVFNIYNFSEDDKTLDLSVLSDGGWPVEITGDTQIVLAGNGGNADITVTTTVPCDAASFAIDVLTLTAVDTNDAEINVSGNVRTTVNEQPPAIVSVTPEMATVYQGTASLLVDIVTSNVPEDAKVLVELLDSDMNPLDPAVTAEGTVDAEGNAQAELALPLDIPLGDYVIQADLEEVESESKTADISVIARPVIVSAVPGAEEITQGETSLEVAVETENAAEGTEVKVTVLDEDGNPLDPEVSGTGTVDAEGKVVITLTLPEDIPLGMYNLLVTLPDAEDNDSAWFEVIAELEPIPATGANGSGLPYTGAMMMLLAGAALALRRRLFQTNS